MSFEFIHDSRLQPAEKIAYRITLTVCSLQGTRQETAVIATFVANYHALETKTHAWVVNPHLR